MQKAINEISRQRKSKLTEKFVNGTDINLSKGAVLILW